MKSIVHRTLNLPSEAPVMVLPGSLLFPHALLPLYIFEQRYRLMLAECLEKRRMFCIALMKTEIESAQGEEDFFHVGALGLIRACIGDPDGTSRLVLQGLARVRFVNFVQNSPFLVAQLCELRSHVERPAECKALCATVLQLCGCLKHSGDESSVEQRLAGISDPSVLADVVSYTFVSDPFHRQQLLEKGDVEERLRLLIRHLSRQLE